MSAVTAPMSGVDSPLDLQEQCTTRNAPVQMTSNKLVEQ